MAAKRRKKRKNRRPEDGRRKAEGWPQRGAEGARIGGMTEGRCRMAEGFEQEETERTEGGGRMTIARGERWKGHGLRARSGGGA